MNRISLILFVLFMGFAGVGFAQDDDPCVQTMDKASEKVFKKAREYHKSGKRRPTSSMRRFWPTTPNISR